MADPTRLFKGMQGTYNPSTNTYSVSATLAMTAFTGNITGNVTGNADTVTTAASTATTLYPALVTAATGSLPLKTTAARLSFNGTTGILTATGFAGDVTGRLTSSGQRMLKRTALTISTTIDGTSDLYAVTALGSAHTFTLASSIHSLATGGYVPVFEVKDETGSCTANDIYLVPASGTINGVGTYTMDANYEGALIYSNGTNFFTRSYIG